MIINKRRKEYESFNVWLGISSSYLGGLGTASYGLTKGMSQQPDMEITFCIPKPWGDEDQSFLKIIGMNSVPIVWRDVQWDYVNSRVGSYMDPQLYYDLREHIYADFNYMHTNDLGCMEFRDVIRITCTKK